MASVTKINNGEFQLTLSAEQLIALHALTLRCDANINHFYDIYKAIDSEISKKTNIIANVSCFDSIEGRSWDNKGIYIDTKAFLNEISGDTKQFLGD